MVYSFSYSLEDFHFLFAFLNMYMYLVCVCVFVYICVFICVKARAHRKYFFLITFQFIYWDWVSQKNSAGWSATVASQLCSGESLPRPHGCWDVGLASRCVVGRDDNSGLHVHMCSLSHVHCLSLTFEVKGSLLYLLFSIPEWLVSFPCVLGPLVNRIRAI